MSCSRNGCCSCKAGPTGPAGPTGATGSGGTGPDVDNAAPPNMSVQFNDNGPFGGAPEILYRGLSVAPGATPGELLVVGPTGHISYGSASDVFPTPDAHNTVGAFLRFGQTVGGQGVTNDWALASWNDAGLTRNLWTLSSDGTGNNATMFFGSAQHTSGAFKLNFAADDINGVWESGQFHFAGASNFGATHTGFLINTNIGIGTIGFSIDAGFGNGVGGLLALYSMSSNPTTNPTDSGGKGAAWIWLDTTTSNTDSKGVHFKFPNANVATVPDVTGPLGLSVDDSIAIANGNYPVTQTDLGNGILTFTTSPNLTADRTITFPAPLANRGYTRLVTMTDTQLNGHNLIFTIGSGTTVTRATFTAGGVQRFLLLVITSTGVAEVI